eukprot:13902963-Ditylum_brightwellii.AAC.1
MTRECGIHILRSKVTKVASCVILHLSSTDRLLINPWSKGWIDTHPHIFQPSLRRKAIAQKGKGEMLTTVEDGLNLEQNQQHKNGGEEEDSKDKVEVIVDVWHEEEG